MIFALIAIFLPFLTFGVQINIYYYPYLAALTLEKRTINFVIKNITEPMTSNSYIVIRPKDDNYLYRLRKYSDEEICASTLYQDYRCQYVYYPQNTSYVEKIILQAANYADDQITFILGFFMREYEGINGQDFYVDIFYSPTKNETILITTSFTPYTFECKNKLNYFFMNFVKFMNNFIIFKSQN